MRHDLKIEEAETRDRGVDTDGQRYGKTGRQTKYQ